MNQQHDDNDDDDDDDEERLLMVGECNGIIVIERQVGLLQDLTAIGITQPGVRKRLTSEISKLSIGDGIPQITPVCIPPLSALSDEFTNAPAEEFPFHV